MTREFIETHAVRPLSDNPHLADWCHELRKGARRQGQGAMRTTANTFCCMGVACDMAGVELITASAMNGFGVDVREIVDSDLGPSEVADLSHLPDWLRETLGLSMEDEDMLSWLNDTRHYTFAAIADVLEHWYRSDVRSVEEAVDRLTRDS